MAAAAARFDIASSARSIAALSAAAEKRDAAFFLLRRHYRPAD